MNRTFPPRARIAFVHSGSSFHLADLADPAVRARDLVEVYAPDLVLGGLDDVDAVYLAARQHPGVLRRIVPVLRDFLTRDGAKIVIDGENRIGEWLPGTGEVPRGTNFWAWRTGEDLGRRCVNQDHPLWEYLTPESVHWHYHAVLAPPPGATALVVLEPVTDLVPGSDAGDEDTGTPLSGGGPRDPWEVPYRALPNHPNALLYHDAVTFPAQVVAMTMDPTYHHGAGFMPGATQLFYRLLDWLAAGELNGGGPSDLRKQVDTGLRDEPRCFAVNPCGDR